MKNWGWVVLSVFSFSSLGWCADPCKVVKMADVGWTDITATTALAAEVLKGAGYTPKVQQVSLPITFMSLKNKDIDVFLGNWLPSMKAQIAPYQKDGSIEMVGTILEGAKYTLAVPRYVWDAGVKSTEDLSKFAAQFKKRIYAIDPGNDGNKHIQELISDRKYNLEGWKMIESSEQAMLHEVAQLMKKKEWVVFLGWQPHPMNRKLSISYLHGGDQYFGPQQGKSTVYISTRKNYAKECPAVVRFLKKFTLNMEIENSLMGMILDDGLDAEVAAKKWAQVNPNQVRVWRDLL